MLCCGEPVTNYGMRDILTAPCRWPVVESNHCSSELMAWINLSPGPGRPRLIAPEVRRSVIALEVASAHADGVDLDQRLTRSMDWNRHGFQAASSQARDR